MVKIMNNELNAPWYKHYYGVRKHLEYPDYSLYEQVKTSCLKYPNFIAFNYYESFLNME